MLAPEPARFIDARVDVFARTEHKQHIGWPERRLDQMPRIDVGDFGLGRQSRSSIGHDMLV
jgi:hypothetical protein